MKLKNILAAITEAETKLVPLFVHNPASQKIAGVAFLAEQTLFAFLEKLDPSAAVAPEAPKTEAK